MPVQARSTASVDAVLDATIQVLLRVGRDRLTTTRVAARAGVSVGTLYQYFPNKSSLLQAVVRRHLETVADEIEQVCRQQSNKGLREMAAALVEGYLRAKFKDADEGAALYSVSSDVDGARIFQEISQRIQRAIADMLRVSRDPLAKEPEVVAAVLQGSIAGVVRNALEPGMLEIDSETLKQELIGAAAAYLESCSG